jgi:hypothetical protein
MSSAAPASEIAGVDSFLLALGRHNFNTVPIVVDGLGLHWLVESVDPECWC